MAKRQHSSTLRRFNFSCKRCRSILEGRSDQCGQPGRCPTCGAEFVIPRIHPRTGVALSDADPGDDGLDPTPMHAYGSAGAKAPVFERREGDTLAIVCPRCEHRSAVEADACGACGLPFTLDGTTGVRAPRPFSFALASLVIGVLSMLTFFCIPAVPALVAIAFGIKGLDQIARSEMPGGRGAAIAGIVCGAVSFALSLYICAGH